MKDYYVAMQSGIVRLTSDSPSAVKGLATLGLEVCLGIVIVGNNGKISLIHLIPNSDISPVIEEFKWVGEHCVCHIGCNPYFSNAVSNYELKDKLESKLADLDIFPKFTMHLCSTGTIAVNRMSRLISKPEPSELKLGNDPSYTMRDFIIKINQHVQFPVPVMQFDGYQWAALPAFNKEAEEFVALCNPEAEKDRINFINHVITPVLKKEEKSYFYKQLIEYNQDNGLMKTKDFIASFHETIRIYKAEKNKAELSSVNNNSITAPSLSTSSNENS